MKGLWYLSGQVTGNGSFRECFDFFEVYYTKLGFNVVNPVKDEPDGKPYGYYMRRDLVKLSGCTGIIMLPNWKKSKGAKFELSVARFLGLEIIYHSR